MHIFCRYTKWIGIVGEIKKLSVTDCLTLKTKIQKVSVETQEKTCKVCFKRKIRNIFKIIN